MREVRSGLRKQNLTVKGVVDPKEYNKNIGEGSIPNLPRKGQKQ